MSESPNTPAYDTADQIAERQEVKKLKAVKRKEEKAKQQWKGKGRPKEELKTGEKTESVASDKAVYPVNVVFANDDDDDNFADDEKDVKGKGKGKQQDLSDEQKAVIEAVNQYRIRLELEKQEQAQREAEKEKAKEDGVTLPERHPDPNNRYDL